VAADLLHLLSDSTHLHRVVEILKVSDPVFFVGCGTSYHACLLGAYYFNQVAGRLALPMLPGQFIERAASSLGPRGAVVFVSQSGETKDVLKRPQAGPPAGGARAGDVQRHRLDPHARQRGLPAIACGYEISVPATKTFMNQALLFHYLALSWPAATRRRSTRSRSSSSGRSRRSTGRPGRPPPTWRSGKSSTTWATG